MNNALKKAGRPVKALIEISDDGLGPCMMALTGAQRAFVTALVIHGLSQSAAAEAAGYSAVSRRSLEVQGSNLAHREDVQAAILELGCKIMRSEGPKTIRFLAAVRDNVGEDTKNRLKAGIELLNRSGFVATTQHNISVEHTHLTDSQKDARIIELCREIGVGEEVARKMLIAPDQVIDADFAEVQPEPVSPEVAAKRARKNELQRARENMTPEELAAHKAGTRAERSARGKVKRAAHESVMSDADALELFGPQESL